MQRYLIEREIPQVGMLDSEQLQAAIRPPNDALRRLGSDIQWIETVVAADKMFCVYLAKDEESIKRHAELSGFLATKITKIWKMIDSGQ